MFHLKIYCITDIGKRRENNQDTFVCGQFVAAENAAHEEYRDAVTLQAPYFAGVFDGMGGEQCGEKASQIAAQTAKTYPIRKNSTEELIALCRTANRSVCDFAEKQKISSSGTTVAALVFGKREIQMLNVGDSKVFCLHGGVLTQISVDDTSVSVMGRKPALSQCIGMREEDCEIIPHVKPLKPKNGMRFLLCSDGLTDTVTTDAVKEIFQGAPNIEQAAQRLLQAALENGGIDNTTVLTAEITKTSIFGRRMKQ